MPDTADRTLARWLRFGGFVLVVAVLYWAQTVLVPLALATLITFVLTPPVAALQRWIGRVPAVLAVAVLVFTVLGLAGWGVAAQMSHLAADLPHYRANIRQKIADVRGASRHGSVEQVQQTVDAIKQQIEQPDAPRGTAHAPVIVQSQRVSSLTDFPAWVGPALGPLSTAGFVITLVIFMLLEREELRARLLGLVGHGNLAVTTKAFDEAGRRVSRQLLMQTLVNTVYAMAVGLGLWSIGVPYPLLWAALGGALRFIPYLGPIAAAAGPILVSLAALPGWHKPLEVVGLFVGLELFTNLVLETVLYAGAAGVSQVALLVAVAAWTWLWGAMGLLLATPLTVCLVVLGKHVPGLEFLSTLIADSPPLAPDAVLYQRLLARDQSEAADIVEQYVAREPAEQIYDALLVPALCYAERDRLEDRLSDDEERQVIEAARELLAEESIAEMAYAGGPDEDCSVFAAAAPVDVFGFAVNGGSDTLALEMLARLVRRDGIRVEVPGARLLTAEIIDRVRERGARILCLADLPPSPPSKARYLVRRLRAALPDAIILVGRWAPPELTEDDRPLLIDAGANSVASTLLETRDQLRQLATTERQRAGSLANAS